MPSLDETLTDIRGAVDGLGFVAEGVVHPCDDCACVAVAGVKPRAATAEGGTGLTPATATQARFGLDVSQGLAIVGLGPSFRAGGTVAEG